MNLSADLRASSILDRALGKEHANRKYWLLLFEKAPLEELLEAAKELITEIFPKKLELCAIATVRRGGCTEDCIFCAQSARPTLPMRASALADEEELIERAKELEYRGVRSFSLVASGRDQGEGDFQRFCRLFRRLREETELSLCASLGFLSPRRALQLRRAGVTRYHNNLESCAAFFPRLCTTHGQREKYTTLETAQKAGLSLCSGGIIGVGEMPVHRIDLALELRELRISSVPLNVLMPISGTPLENSPLPTPEEILRTLALFRLILPRSRIRLAGGRKTLGESLSRALLCCADGLMTGNYLTTTGSDVRNDVALIESLGLEILS